MKTINLSLALWLLAAQQCRGDDEGLSKCKNPFNWGLDECREWFESIMDANYNEDGGVERIINGEEVPLYEYPWFAKARRGESWGGMYIDSFVVVMM